jgi:ribonucleoside-diphosphate reductase alpha chain
MAKYSNGLEDGLDIPPSSVTVLEKRYLAKDERGNILETGESMFRRVARDIASAEILYKEKYKGEADSKTSTEKLYKIAGKDETSKQWEEKYFNLMVERKFLPNSPTLMNAGRKLQQLSACFVLPIGDSMEEIFETVKKTALVHKSGGGTGFSFSKLRPNGAYIHSTTSYSPGPLSFLRTLDATTETVKQGGKRRGANMGVIKANHPDSFDFATIKNQEGLVANFNLSLAFTDEEINAIKEDKYILLEDPRKGIKYTVENARNRKREISWGRKDSHETAWELSEDEKLIINTKTQEEIGKVENDELCIRTREIFNNIIDGAWKNGEPGIIFLDRMNEYNPTPEVGEIESTNPCGEQPLLPYESCNLGSINLSEHVSKRGTLDEKLLKDTVRTSVRFLDNVIERNKYPHPEIEKMTKANRKIGLGIMGFAHYLIKRGISYNSKEAVDESEKVMKLVNKTSKEASRELAKERGAFPNFDKSIYKNGEPIRNATTTTIAPTGTIGVIASTSQGIEPIFANVQIRNVKESIGENLIETDREFEKYLKEKGIYDEIALNGLIKSGTSIQESLIPKNIKDEITKLFITAHHIPSDQHLRIQQAFQKHTDNAVSKTINLPHETTKEEISEIYLKAHEMGLKGLTIYREGSRGQQLLETSLKLFPEKKTNLERKVGESIIRGRDIPEVIGLPGITYQIPTGCGSLFVTVNYDGENPIEIFENMNPPGGCGNAQTSTAGISVSLGLQYSNNPAEYLKKVKKHLRKISCPRKNDLIKKVSCSQAIIQAIELFEEDIERVKEGYVGPFFKEGINRGSTQKARINSSRALDNPDRENTCPECKSSLTYSEGCKGGKCSDTSGCGWSECL